jgi:hypothetical protein
VAAWSPYKEVRDEGVFYNYGTGDTEGYNIDNWNGEVQLEGDIGDSNFSWWTKYTDRPLHDRPALRAAAPAANRTCAL